MKNLKAKIDFALIIVSAAVLMFTIGFSQPLVIAPIDNYMTTDTQVLFSIEKGDKLLIDDNIEFTSPDEYEVVDGLELEFSPGRYYWKAIGVGFSEVRTLTIESQVSLEVVEDENNFSVVNSGNIELLVDVYDGEELIEKRKLEVGEKTRGDGNKFLGESNE
jgi:hypothetical protein